MLHNIKPLYLHCVFHGIRFKVNNEDWLSVMDSLFYFIKVSIFVSVEKGLSLYFVNVNAPINNMKRIFCPKCDNQLSFDETKYPDGQVLAFVCPQCGSQFKIKLGRKTIRTESGQEKEVKEPDFSCGYITVIENTFGFKQDLPLVLGDNMIGRRNKDTEGVDVPIITSDPSVGRKHCIINVKQDKEGKFIYTLRDNQSMTGTFLRSVILGKKEQVRIGEGAIVTMGATTFILHTANEEEEEDF